MTAAFGHRWTSAHGDNFAETSGRVWAVDLAGIGQRALQRGLDTARRAPDGWPPVLADFRFYCLGGLPITEVDANLQKPPAEWHPFSVLVKRGISEAEWRMKGPDEQWRMLERAHARAKAHLLAGGGLPAYTPASQQITHEDRREPPPPIMMSTEECLAACRQALRMPDPEPVAAPIVLRERESCIRCNGTRKDPQHQHHPKQYNPGECLACFGSGVEASYNRIVREDGTIQERLL